MANYDAYAKTKYFLLLTPEEVQAFDTKALTGKIKPPLVRIQELFPQAQVKIIDTCFTWEEEANEQNIRAIHTLSKEYGCMGVCTWEYASGEISRFAVRSGIITYSRKGVVL